MTTPSYSELVTAVRREGEGILAAAGMDLDAAVPTCGDWDLSALVQHVSRIYANVARILSTRATEAPASRPEVPDGEPVAVLSHLLDELVAALSDCDADTPVWTWPDDAPNVALFWARRMAHESSVHRYDAQASHGVVQPIDAELAGDGLDELVDIIAPRVYGRMVHRARAVSRPPPRCPQRAGRHGPRHLERVAAGVLPPDSVDIA
jgi:uncharacterized protein (TIGR03083 family)